MARPRLAGGEDGLQIRRVAANILNKQSRRADRGWSPACGLGVGLLFSYEMPHRASDLDGFFG
jgi:hypothetical protein